ncbi:uncharacterized protein LOC120559688 [Scomber scombrus]|uniref:Uncharacterized protein LOC120559688 n=1 Tax=Scomber scombrus TaxID=13677 RepID=A0AAV1PV12_SCOSC
MTHITNVHLSVSVTQQKCPQRQAKRAIIKEKKEYDPIEIVTLALLDVNAYLSLVRKSTEAGIIDAYTMTAVWQRSQKGFRRTDFQASGSSGHWPFK